MKRAWATFPWVRGIGLPGRISFFFWARFLHNEDDCDDGDDDDHDDNGDDDHDDDGIILSVRYYLLNIWFDKLSFSNNFFGNFLFVYLFIWFDKMFLREHMSPH